MICMHLYLIWNIGPHFFLVFLLLNCWGLATFDLGHLCRLASSPLELAHVSLFPDLFCTTQLLWCPSWPTCLLKVFWLVKWFERTTHYSSFHCWKHSVSLAERIKLSFVNQDAPLSGWRKLPSHFLDFLNTILPPCTGHCPQVCFASEFRQIMVLKDHSLIFFILVKEYGSRIKLEILILHFENKNCFDVSLKQFAFEILQLLGYFLSWKRDYLLLCLVMRSSVKIRHEMTFCFKVKGSRKSSRFCMRKTCLFLNIHFYQHE
jgi:hypothetical protein